MEGPGPGPGMSWLSDRLLSPPFQGQGQASNPCSTSPGAQSERARFPLCPPHTPLPEGTALEQEGLVWALQVWGHALSVPQRSQIQTASDILPVMGAPSLLTRCFRSELLLYLTACLASRTTECLFSSGQMCKGG